jgi:hypothetical protein
MMTVIFLQRGQYTWSPLRAIDCPPVDEKFVPDATDPPWDVLSPTTINALIHPPLISLFSDNFGGMYLTSDIAVN